MYKGKDILLNITKLSIS